MKVKKYIDRTKVEVYELMLKYNVSMRDFALLYKEDKNFAFVAKILNGGEDYYDIIKDFIKKKAYRLMEAREFLKTGNF